MFNKMIEDGGEILYTRWLWLIDKSRESCRFIAKCLRSRCTDYFSLGLIFLAGNHWPATGHSFLLPWLIKQRNLNAYQQDFFLLVTASHDDYNYGFVVQI